MSRIYIGSKSRTLDNLKSEFPSKNIISVFDTENQIKSFSKFFDLDKIFLHINPSNEDIKLVNLEIDNNKGLHYLFFDDDSYDGRNSLIQKIKKENNIFNFSHPVLGDKSLLQRMVINYVKSKNCSIDYSVFEWLYENCPIIRLKSKVDKKEKLCYDLDILFKEIDKISSIKETITIEDFSYSLFNSDGDIFLFIESLINKDEIKSFEIYDKLVDTMGDQAVLMIVLYQLIFLIQINGLKSKYYDINKIINNLELRDLLNKYYDDDWNELNIAPKSQNPIRVKIELSKETINVKKLSDMLIAIVDCVKDIRNGGVSQYSTFIMINRIMRIN